MFTPTLHCECAQPGLIDTMRKWSIAAYMYLLFLLPALKGALSDFFNYFSNLWRFSNKKEGSINIILKVGIAHDT